MSVDAANGLRVGCVWSFPVAFTATRGRTELAFLAALLVQLVVARRRHVDVPDIGTRFLAQLHSNLPGNDGSAFPSLSGRVANLVQSKVFSSKNQYQCSIGETQYKAALSKA